MKNENDLKYARYKKRKYLRYAIIIVSIMTIVLATLSLTIKLGIGYALVTFIITLVLKRMYVKVDAELSKDDHKEKNNKKAKGSSKKAKGNIQKAKTTNNKKKVSKKKTSSKNS